MRRKMVAKVLAAMVAGLLILAPGFVGAQLGVNPSSQAVNLIAQTSVALQIGDYPPAGSTSESGATVVRAAQPTPEPPPTPTPPPGGGPAGSDPLIERLIPIAVRVPSCALAFFGLKPAVTQQFLRGGLTPDEIAALKGSVELAAAGVDAATLLELFRSVEAGDWTPAIVAFELLKPGPLVCAEGIVEIFLPGQQKALITCLKGQTETARECRRLIFEQLNPATTDPGPIGQPQPDLVPPFIPGTIPPRFIGSWSGSVTQDGYAPYPAEIDVSGGSVGTTIATGTYESLGCTVHWTLKEANMSTIVVRETVDQGSNCIDVDITLTSDSTIQYDAGGIARATLQRAR